MSKLTWCRWGLRDWGGRAGVKDGWLRSPGLDGSLLVRWSWRPGACIVPFDFILSVWFSISLFEGLECKIFSSQVEKCTSFRLYYHSMQFSLLCKRLLQELFLLHTTTTQCHPIKFSKEGTTQVVQNSDHGNFNVSLEIFFCVKQGLFGQTVQKNFTIKGKG